MLPVLQISDQITAALRKGHRLVLTAPTGSGKTTQVPRIIHQSGIVASEKKIIVLQPRRLATRLVAQRVAHEMGVAIGQLVGYQTRHESKVSAASRIIFMTEGLLLRQMQRDPTLRDVGVVILDEFHERSLAADMSLGLLSRLQETSRRDLKLIVMSATLDAKLIADRLKCETLEAGAVVSGGCSLRRQAQSGGAVGAGCGRVGGVGGGRARARGRGRHPHFHAWHVRDHAHDRNVSAPH